MMKKNKFLIFLAIAGIMLNLTSCMNDYKITWSGENTFKTETIRGIFGKAIWFNGKDAFMTGPAPVTFENEMTVAVWVRCDEWEGGDRGIVGNISFLSDRGFLIYYNGYANQLKFQLNIDNIVEILSVAPPLAGTWHLLAGTYNGSELCFYVDGRLRSKKRFRVKSSMRIIAWLQGDFIMT